jgi:transaldolase/glucose-6-phosphate isomerase
VASKSGTTLEPDILHRYFWARVAGAVGESEAGERFVAITDPGSKLETTAREQRFRRFFLGDPAIGGRYSVLSNFGLVPAAVIGVDVDDFLARTRTMTRACGASAPPGANPGVDLGLLIGTAARIGRDKLTIFASHGLADVGAWLEQLLAESTGKHGRGIIPVAGEPAGPADRYGDDRLFAYLRLAGVEDLALDGAVRALEEAGQPVVRITLAGRETLGQEFVRWEVATAVAGAVIGINPFDQPDVEASKVKARALTDAYEAGKPAQHPAPLVEEAGLSLFADPQNAAALKASGEAVGAWLENHLARAQEGDYVGLLAWLDRKHAYVRRLDALRARIRNHTRRATVVGFGPRFLHSTGQAYKGGPNSGVFLQITADPVLDKLVPGRTASFGVVAAAQAAGDAEVLAERGRRLLRVHLGRDVESGLARLIELIERALG